MKILVKTAGLLGSYLPPGSERNRAVIRVSPGSTPLDVMRQLRMPLENSYLVSLNGTVVQVAERDTQVLNDDDQLAIMPPLKGG